MIREVCSCGAEFECDLPDQVELVTKWRRTHKHTIKDSTSGFSTLSDNQVALGFRPVPEPEDND
jgi:hypothetical protein